MSNKNKSGLKRSPVVAAEIVVISILLIIIAIMLFLCFSFKRNGNTVTLFGTKLYYTRAVNMQPNIPEKTLILAKETAAENINAGSVVLCKIGDDTVLIRVVDVQEENGERFFIVKFDTSPENKTFKIDKDDVVAKAYKQAEAFGKIISFATSALGIMLIIIIPSFLIILFQIIKIINIKRLEEEAASLDDIDDIIFSNRSNEVPPPVTITKPVFYEDVTDKIPVLGVDKNGRADYSLKKQNEGSPLFTSDMYNKQSSREPSIRMPASSSYRRNASDIDNNESFYVNKPTKIEKQSYQPKSKVDEFFEAYNPEKRSTNSEQKSDKNNVTAVFTPYISNVIPDRIASVQENVTSSSVSSFDESIKAYYEKAEENRANEAKEIVEGINTIPEKAVIPKETIAPPVRKKNSKALDELLSIIDKEESKLKIK